MSLISAPNQPVQNRIYQAPMPKALAELPKPALCQRIKNFIGNFFLFIPNLLFTACILPALSKRVTPAEREAALEGAERISFQTPDKAKIDGMMIRGGERKAILYVGGNGTCYEENHQIIRSLRNSVGDITVMSFNPHGVGESKGKPTAKNLALDVHAAFRYLVDVQGIAPNDIVIFGHSLGGGYGAEGAALVQQDFPDQEIHFVSHNSFVDLKTEVHYMANYVVPRFLKRIAMPFINRLLTRDRWELDEIGAMQRLRGQKLVIVNKGDSVIPYRCSLYKGLKALNTPLNIPVIKMDPNEYHLDPGVDHGQYQHCRFFNAWERYEVLMQLRRMLRMPDVAVSMDPRINALGQASAEPKWARPYLKSMSAIHNLRGMLVLPPNVPDEQMERHTRWLVSEHASAAILSKPLASLPPVTNRPSESGTPHELFRGHQGRIPIAEGINRHIRAFNRSQVEVALQFLLAQLTHEQPISQAALTETLAQLAATPIDPRDGLAGNHANYAELLFANIREQCNAHPGVGEPNYAREFILGTRQPANGVAREQIQRAAIEPILNQMRQLRTA